MQSSSLHENVRLDLHFQRALRILHARRPRLTPARARARTRVLGELDAYRLRGQFPKNRSFPGLFVPTFVDTDVMRTHCAVAHLMAKTGDAELVDTIARTRNHARVPGLAGIAALHDWLDRNGLSLDEATIIQPAYCESAADACICESGSITVIEGTIASVDPLTLYVEKIHGEASGLEAGAVVTLDNSSSTLRAGIEEGTTVVAPYLSTTDDPFAYSALEISGGVAQSGTLQCGVGRAQAPDTVSKDVLINAWLDTPEGCRSALIEEDDAWGEEYGNSCGGCQVGGGMTSADGVIAVVAGAWLVGAAAKRKWRRG